MFHFRLVSLKLQLFICSVWYIKQEVVIRVVSFYLVWHCQLFSLRPRGQVFEHFQIKSSGGTIEEVSVDGWKTTDHSPSFTRWALRVIAKHVQLAAHYRTMTPLLGKIQQSGVLECCFIWIRTQGEERRVWKARTEQGIVSEDKSARDECAL